MPQANETTKANFSAIVVFGDSLSDNGNFHDLAAGFIVRDNEGAPLYSVPFQYDGDGTVRPYSERAFTDGTAYSDTLAGLLGLDASYENYAFGGAQALGEKKGAGYIQEYDTLSYRTLDGGTANFSIVDDLDAALAAYGNFDINLGGQVDRFIAETAGTVQPGTLAIINIGANDLGAYDADFFDILFGGVGDFAHDLARELEIQARRLAEAGVDTIALFRLPVAEFFVGYDDLSWYERPIARDLIDAVNSEITYRAGRLDASGIDTELVRIDIMSEELLVDKASHGFLYHGPYLFGYSGDPDWVETAPGVIEPVYKVSGSAEAYRAEQILFFDEIHPSGALHDMLGVFTSEALSSEVRFGNSSGNELRLTAADEMVVARDGNDVVWLRGGDDVGLGGRGNDIIGGGAGSDIVIGGGGADVLRGGKGHDVLAGSAGDDTLYGGALRDILIGGLGGDKVFGGQGHDVFVFLEEDLWGGPGGQNDEYFGGAGIDTLLVFLGSEALPTQTVADNGTTTLNFLDGATLTATDIERVVFHVGLPEDEDSPFETLWFNEVLEARYDEAQLWGIV